MKTCSKYKGMQKKKGGLGADGTSINGKQSNQTGIAEEEVERCDVLSVNSDRVKGRFSGCLVA